MSGKACVVAGVGPGTGAALSRRFAAGGYRVAMLARDAERLTALEREIDGSRGHPVDVTDAAAVQDVVRRIGSEIGTPAVLVHNAVSGHFAEFLNVTPADLERTSQTNVLSLVHLGQALVPGMIERGGGAIVVTATPPRGAAQPISRRSRRRKRRSGSSRSRWRGASVRAGSTSPTSSSPR